MKKLTLRPPLPSPETEYWLGRQFLTGELLSQRTEQYGYQTVIIADAAIASTLGAKLSCACQAKMLTIPGGEHCKTREMKQQLEDALLREKYGRDTVLIALGGGVTMDLVGFLASTYLRGVPLILVPTTLLAAVDAAIGGKTGVDTPHGKNLIGTFYLPKAIIVDLNVLQTLPTQEWLNGLAEILKSALIANAALWDLCERPDWREQGPLEQIVEWTALVKMQAIGRDPLENGMRRMLNFGHTIAHGLEAIAQYKIAHGEAVALGLIVESYLSMQLGYLSPVDFAAIQRRLSQAGFALRLPADYNRQRFLEALCFDKKKARGTVRFTLIEAIGKALPFDGEYCRPIPPTSLDQMIAWMEQCYG